MEAESAFWIPFQYKQGYQSGGIMAIYHCVVIHSALELGGYGGKVTIYLRNDKGNGKKFLREVGNGNVKWMIYEEVAKLQSCKVAKLQNGLFNKVNI